MKSKIISAILCLAVIGGTWYLLQNYSPTKSNEGEEVLTGQEDTGAKEETPETVSVAFVNEAAHDAEDLMVSLAYGKTVDFESALKSLVTRLDKSSDYLKDTVQDYYGASYFTKISDVFEEVLTTPFTDSQSFSTRVAKILTELENSYPAEGEAASDIYYPKFDATASGTTSLAMLSIYRQQYQKSTGSILLTFGGNLVIGDTLLNTEAEGSYKNLHKNAKYPFPLASLSSVLGTDTASFANLKTPLTEEVGTSTQAGAIKGVKEYAKSLKEGGMDVLSLSDPGVLGFGEKGKTDTQEALKEAGLSFTGEGAICYVETPLGLVAYLTYDIIDEIGGNVNLTYKDAPKQDIAAAKTAGAKIVVVHFNWVNTEKNAWDPCLSQVLTTRAAVDNGASLVIGTHPDSLEGIEKYNGVSIVYSAGNLYHKDAGGQSSFLFQQAFTLNEAGEAVPGQIQYLPLAIQGDGSSKLVLDAAGAQKAKGDIQSYSRTVRFGVGKRDTFTTDDLNIIAIEK